MSKTVTIKNIPIKGKVLSNKPETYKTESGEEKTSYVVRILQDDFIRTVYFEKDDAELCVVDAEVELMSIAFAGVSKNGEPYVIYRNQKD